MAPTGTDAPALLCLGIVVLGMRMSHNPANRGEENDGSDEHLPTMSGPTTARLGSGRVQLRVTDQTTSLRCGGLTIRTAAAAGRSILSRLGIGRGLIQTVFWP